MLALSHLFTCPLMAVNRSHADRYEGDYNFFNTGEFYIICIAGTGYTDSIRSNNSEI